MKNTKKVLALVLAVVMVLALSVSAFAAADYSITINNAKAGETYTAYKMFDLSVNDPEKPTAYRYTVNSAWKNFAETPEFKAVYSVDAQGYVSSTAESTEKWDATSALSKVADAAAKFAKDNHILEAGHVTIGAGQTTGKINLSEAGYYVVSSTLGTRAMIETTPSDTAVTINEKNEEDSIDKQVKEDSTGEYRENNDAQIGDTVEFKSEATIAARSINVKIHDTMDGGLTLNGDSIKIYTDSALENEYTEATVNTGTKADKDDTFTIVIPDKFAATATEAQKLYIVYTAVLNENAITKDADGKPQIDPQTNKTSISYGDKQSQEDETTTTTHKFSVFKHATGSTANLADAVFSLKKNGVVVNLTKIDGNNYKVDPNGTETTFTTVSDGDIVIWGVDADNDYTLEEITPPEGYNKLATNKPVTVDEKNDTRIDVENKTGTELPSTGGIGTTIFYIVGAILVIGAAVLLITKKRMSAEQ